METILDDPPSFHELNPWFTVRSTITCHDSFPFLWLFHFYLNSKNPINFDFPRYLFSTFFVFFLILIFVFLALPLPFIVVFLILKDDKLPESKKKYTLILILRQRRKEETHTKFMFEKTRFWSFFFFSWNMFLYKMEFFFIHRFQFESNKEVN